MKSGILRKRKKRVQIAAIEESVNEGKSGHESESVGLLVAGQR